jgi:hypothetical protein
MLYEESEPKLKRSKRKRPEKKADRVEESHESSQVDS